MSTALFCASLIYANALGWAVFFAAARWWPAPRPAYWWRTGLNAPATVTVLHPARRARAFRARRAA